MTVLSWLPIPWDFRGNVTTTPYPGDRTRAIAGLDDLFTQLGSLDLTQTADTGQYVLGGDPAIDYVDVAAGTSLGYRVYRFDDSLAATHPLFVKIAVTVGYKGWTSGYGVFPRCTVTVGTATDGAGGITTNAVSGWFTLGTSNAYQANFRLPDRFRSFASSSPAKGFLGVCFNAGQKRLDGNAGVQEFADLVFFLERIPNLDGTPSTKGFTLFTPEQVISRVASESYAHSDAIIMKAKTRVTDEGKTYIADQGMPVFPQTFISPDYLMNHFYHSAPNPVRSCALAAVSPTGLGAGAQFEALVYGNTASNFLVLPKEAKNLRPCVPEMCVAMLWE